MTKGNSVAIGTPYGNFIRGNKDKLMISYRREPSHDYTMRAACGVLFQGEIHFFGGYPVTYPYKGIDFTRQHFVIETKRTGQLVKMSKKEDLEIGIAGASCSSFEPKFVVLCFDFYHQKSCYSFDGQLNYIGDSNYEHFDGGLTKYKGSLLTVGSKSTQKIEITKINENSKISWSVEPDFNFIQGKNIECHSLVTVKSSDINEEYVLLIGGRTHMYMATENVFKFNGNWSFFGKLNKMHLGHS